MNEKLLEEMFAEATNGNGLPVYVDSIHRIEIERFAEIIVRRCAKIVNQNDFDGSTLGDRLLYPNFGVDCNLESNNTQDNK